MMDPVAAARLAGEIAIATADASELASQEREPPVPGLQSHLISENELSVTARRRLPSESIAPAARYMRSWHSRSAGYRG
nr:hypothetical protein GCM10017745_75280 [Saccharothrix mutabilis subsp. capreolus]